MKSPNVPNLTHASRFLQTHISPLSPKAVYGGECAKRLRAPRKRRLWQMFNLRFGMLRADSSFFLKVRIAPPGAHINQEVIPWN